MKRKFNILNREQGLKICNYCDNGYVRNKYFSSHQWSSSKFCSSKCCGESKKIKDGMDKGERWRRKRGSLKQGTPEWLAKISATTKEGMLKPEVKQKMSMPRKPMTLDNRIIRSDALIGILPKNMMFSNNGSYPNVQRGEYDCSKGSVYFRSKWEANYALFLDFLIKSKEILNWEFEEDTFFFDKIKLGTRSYKPDFKIFNKDGSIEYHEVKGYMDSRSKTKLKRMAKYFPDTKLILIERKQYMEILKKLKGLIRFY